MGKLFSESIQLYHFVEEMSESEEAHIIEPQSVVPKKEPWYKKLSDVPVNTRPASPYTLTAPIEMDGLSWPSKGARERLESSEGEEGDKGSLVINKMKMNRKKMKKKNHQILPVNKNNRNQN